MLPDNVAQFGHAFKMNPCTSKGRDQTFIRSTIARKYVNFLQSSFGGLGEATKPLGSVVRYGGAVW